MRDIFIDFGAYETASLSYARHFYWFWCLLDPFAKFNIMKSKGYFLIREIRA